MTPRQNLVQPPACSLQPAASSLQPPACSLQPAACLPPMLEWSRASRTLETGLRNAPGQFVSVSCRRRSECSCRSRSCADADSSRCCLPNGKGNASSVSVADRSLSAQSGTLAEPPAAADEPALPPTADPRRPVTEDPSPPEPLIPPVPDPSLPAEMPVPRVDMRPPRHASRPRHKFAQAVTLLLLAVASSSALIVVLRDHGWSVAAILGVAPRQESTPPPVAPASIDSAAQVATGPLDAPPAEQGVEATAGTVAGAETGTSSGTRLANLTPLAAEDGLLLTGMFGDDYQRLQLSESQQESADSLVARLKQNDQGLKDKNVTLEQWYADSRKAGDELLAVLTDAQRQQLQVMLERGRGVPSASRGVFRADSSRTCRSTNALVRAVRRSVFSGHCQVFLHSQRPGSGESGERANGLAGHVLVCGWPPIRPRG